MLGDCHVASDKVLSGRGRKECRLRRFAANWASIAIFAICGECSQAAEEVPNLPQAGVDLPSDRCVDRLATAQPPPIALRVSSLSYRCLKLPSGRALWLGEAGSARAPTVLLVHGLGNYAHRDWRQILPVLADRYHVVAVDLPGFGASQSLPGGYSFAALSDTLAQVLDQLQIRQAHVVGHSLGGAVSLYFAHTHANRVEQLILVDASGILQKAVYVRHMAQTQLPQSGFEPLDWLLGGIDRRVNGLGGIVLTRMEERADLAAWLVENPPVRNALLGRYTQIDAALGLVEHDFTQAIREVTAPTTLIWGRNDPIAPLRTGTLLVSRLRNARLHVIDGVEHVPMVQAPEKFLSLLLPALSGVSAPTFARSIPNRRHGQIICRNQSNVIYSGYFESLTLQGCKNVRIERASLRQLTLVASTASLTFVQIDSSGVALSAKQSQVVATGVDIRSRVGVRAEDSRLDLAGVSLWATQAGVVSLTGSRVYFSVSDLVTPEFSGDAHRIWPDAASAPPRAVR